MALYKSAESLSIGMLGYTVFETGHLIKFMVSSEPILRYNSIYCNMLIFKDIDSVQYEKYNKDLKLFGINVDYSLYKNYTLSFEDIDEALYYSTFIKSDDELQLQNVYRMITQ